MTKKGEPQPILVARMPLDKRGRIFIDKGIREAMNIGEGATLEQRLFRSPSGWTLMLREVPPER